MSVHRFSLAPGSTVATALRQLPFDALENRILLMHGLQMPRIALVTQSERILGPDEGERIAALVERRIAGEPIAYILGEREFFGLAFHVSHDVLIPRPDTELLVELALERLPAGGKVIDLGTGSGAVAVAIAHQRPDLEVHATDISSPALEIAARNAARHQVPVRLHKSDWYSALADSGFDLIVSNPPYIHRDDPHLSQGDLRFEPTAALTDHGDGLSALRTIIRGADRFLKPGGWLLLEHGYDQAVAVRQILTDAGFAEVQSWKDLPGIERVSGGRREA